nr:insulinase family protein [Chitinophagaceae bacterium]
AIEKKSKIINDPNGIQSSIKIARLFPTKRHPDYAKAYLLNTILGGYFGSRLMMNIREDKGYTYGIYSMFANLRQQSAWIISTEAGKEVSDATIAETYKEMKRLREEPVSNDELNLVRNFIMGLLLGYLNGSFNIIMRWKDMILHHLDESHFYQLVQTIQTVTAEELQELAQKYLQPEDFYELVVV